MDNLVAQFGGDTEQLQALLMRTLQNDVTSESAAAGKQSVLPPKLAGFTRSFGEVQTICEVDTSQKPNVFTRAQVMGAGVCFDSRFRDFSKDTAPKCCFFNKAGGPCRGSIGPSGANVVCRSASHLALLPQLAGLAGTEVSAKSDEIGQYPLYSMLGDRFPKTKSARAIKADILAVYGAGKDEKLTISASHVKVLQILGVGHPGFKVEDPDTLAAHKAIRYRVASAASSIPAGEAVMMALEAWR
jgi:hypothetical protein